MTTFPPSCVDCLETWESQPPENLRVCPGLFKVGITFTVTLTFNAAYPKKLKIIKTVINPLYPSGYCTYR
jgi:hypothetical protein